MHSWWAKLNQDFNQLLFFIFPFVSSSPQPVPQNGHSIYVVVSFSTRGLLPLDRCSMILSVSTKAINLYRNKLRHSVSFQYCSVFWHFKGARTLHRDGVEEWRGECAHSEWEVVLHISPAWYFSGLELLSQCSHHHAGKLSVLSVWTQLKLVLT